MTDPSPPGRQPAWTSAHNPYAPPPEHWPPPTEPPRKSRWRTPAVLFVLTCLSTFLTYGPFYAAAIMAILLCHELGHYVQARRYGVPASLPYFLPFPFSPFGTLGAVIAMRPHSATGRALYDIAITGPLAGLVPTLAFAAIGLSQSSYVPNLELPEGPPFRLHAPLLFRWISQLMLGPAPAEHTLVLGPLAYAAWVGIFITALNLLPVGQLDGGHILYALIPRRAHGVSMALFGLAVAAVVAYQLWFWSLMMLLLALVGLRHPPVRDRPPFELGLGRHLLGWAVLLFIFIGFSPVPLTEIA